MEETILLKRGTETPKKSSPLKAVSPIIRKYSGHRQGRIKKKLKFPRILHGGRTRTVKPPVKPQLKVILPKTTAGDIIVLEPELLPCALNLHPNKKKEEVDGNVKDSEQSGESDEKPSEPPAAKETSANIKTNKSKLLALTKKKAKYYKNIEATLGLLEPETVAAIDKREENFAENYLSKVQQRLKGKEDTLYEKFVDLISNFQTKGITIIDLYKQVRDLFTSHSDLAEEFVAFLTPEQAVECGVFMDHHLFTVMTELLNMINIHFSKSPHQVKKIHSVLDSLATKKDVTTDDVMSAILPLLKGNSILLDHFLCLLPHGRPPDNFLLDFEEIEYPDLNSDMSEDEEIFETVHIPEVEDPFGGDSCSCSCHDSEDEKFKSKLHHCVSCSTKFINGKIFIQCGKLLRPAKVVFDDHDTAYHRDRLAPTLYPKRGRKRTRHAIFKENLSPTKSCNLSSDEFKSDIEDDDKARSKPGACKSPRISRKKSVSPKNCDKIIPRCIFSETKVEVAEVEEKTTLSSDGPDEEKSQMEPEEVTVVVSALPAMAQEDDLLSGIKQFNLPEIEVTEPISTQVEPTKVLEEGQAENQSSLIITKERSKSPPVISIPDSGNSCLFSTSKPILSLLAKLDDSKETMPVLAESASKVGLDSDIICGQDIKSEIGEENNEPWKMEEDRIILQTLQVEENCEDTFVKINSKIPSRSVEEIKKRFATLMNMLYEMKAKTTS